MSPSLRPSSNQTKNRQFLTPFRLLSWVDSADTVLIFSVLVIASCGLAYELISGALASYVLGDSVLQFSTIIGTYLFAMGVGSHLSKYVPSSQLIQRFVQIEVLVGLIGGLSAIGLFLGFAWIPTFKVLLYSVVFCIGVMVGVEIPLVMRILNERQQAFNEVVSKVLTFDYLGALIVSLLFPIVLAPTLGLARTAVLFGIANVLIALLTAWYFFSPNFYANNQESIDTVPDKDFLNVSNQIQQRNRLISQALSVLAVLLIALFYADSLVSLSEQKRFNAPIVYATSSPYQRLVVTQRNKSYELFLNGNLQFSTRDEYRYHEALIHPVMQTISLQHTATQMPIKVLVLGGGDGMAVREIVKYPLVKSVTLVDLDKKMTDMFTHEARFTRLNDNALANSNVQVINDDAFRWLNTQQQALLSSQITNNTAQTNRSRYDVIIIDLPDPSNYSLAKLYSVSMYQMAKAMLAENGLMVVQSTSPYFAPKSFWCINTTLQQAAFATIPYHLYVPSFGEWGFIIAKAKSAPPFSPPSYYDLPMRFLTPNISQAMFEFPQDMQPVNVKPNTLDKQILVKYYQEDWQDE